MLCSGTAAPTVTASRLATACFLFRAWLPPGCCSRPQRLCSGTHQVCSKPCPARCVFPARHGATCPTLLPMAVSHQRCVVGGLKCFFLGAIRSLGPSLPQKSCQQGLLSVGIIAGAPVPRSSLVLLPSTSNHLSMIQIMSLSCLECCAACT